MDILKAILVSKGLGLEARGVLRLERLELLERLERLELWCLQHWLKHCLRLRNDWCINDLLRMSVLRNEYLLLILSGLFLVLRLRLAHVGTTAGHVGVQKVEKNVNEKSSFDVETVLDCSQVQLELWRA